jgi:hypothetical protein
MMGFPNSGGLTIDINICKADALRIDRLMFRPGARGARDGALHCALRRRISLNASAQSAFLHSAVNRSSIFRSRFWPEAMAFSTVMEK